MERRRARLGVKRYDISAAEKPNTSSKYKSDEILQAQENVKIKGIRPQRSQPSINAPNHVTPKHTTPKHTTPNRQNNVTPHKTQSPCSPHENHGFQALFPSTLGSPEIEVSWDWSCSQTPKDMLPPKRMKRIRKVQPSLLSNATATICTRLSHHHQMTEEENQERLAFYKNILSKTLKNDTEGPSNSLNNNLEADPHEIKLNITPKRTPRRSSAMSSGSRKKEEQINSFFDDSANELMIECSQVIEEKLKNGELHGCPIVDVDISQVKRTLSPTEDKSNINKRPCYGRVNLFPENTRPKINLTEKPNTTPQLNISSSSITNQSNSKFEKRTVFPTKYDERITAKSVYSNTVQIPDSKCSSNEVINQKNFQEKQVLSTNINSVNRMHNKVISTYNVNADKSQNSIKIPHYDSVDKFRKTVKVNVLSNNNQSNPSVLKTNNLNKQILNENKIKVNIAEIAEESRLHNISCQDEGNTNSPDLTSLLDDGLDMVLSSLDVDSLCHSSENKETATHALPKPVPKLCTKQEIEAKRLAALQKLMMKKRR